MKIYPKLFFGLMILFLVCVCSVAIWADETEDTATGSPEVTATPKPIVITAQDSNLAQELSTAYNITVTPQEIADLRVNNNLGYGGIALLYGLTNASGKTVTDIITMRQQDLGWGEIANSLGLKVSDIMKKSSSILKTAKMGNEEKKLANELNKKPRVNKQDGNIKQNDSNNQGNGKTTQNSNNGSKGSNDHKK